MSGLFLVEARDRSVWALVRANCLNCAREQAVKTAGLEGTLVWRDPELSSVRLVTEPPRGVGLVLRSEYFSE